MLSQAKYQGQCTKLIRNQIVLLNYVQREASKYDLESNWEKIGDAVVMTAQQ